MLTSWSRTPKKKKKKAFTLLELIVVIVILGVLAAIAVPTFKAVIDRSSDEATLTSLRAMAREAQALRAFDQGPWDDTQMTVAASDTTATAVGAYAATAEAVRDSGKDPARGQVTYVIDGEGLALAKLSTTGRVCIVGANHGTVASGRCGPSKATAEKSTLSVILSDPEAAVLPPGTSTASGSGGTSTGPGGITQPPAPTVTAPGAPTGVTATAGNGTATISFTPGTDGGERVSYVVTSSPGNVTANGTESPISVSGLTNGAPYTFTVTAVNSAGRTTSEPSSSVTPQAPQSDLTNATWSNVASMSTGRYQLAMERGSDGLLYAFGGQVPGTGAIVATVERYDTTTNTWSAAPSMAAGRRQLASAVDTAGRIYAIGGVGSNGSPLATVERFDPAAGTWSRVADLPSGLHLHAATTGGDGKLYVSGGLSDAGYSTAVYRYDPATDAWTTLTSLPGRRYAHIMETDGSGRVYTIGGHDGVNGATSAVHRYDATANSWTAVASTPGAFMYSATAVDSAGRIHLIGGNTNSDTDVVLRYDSSTNAWSAAAKLPQPRHGGAAARDASGRIFVAGGSSSNTTLSSVVRLG